MKSLSNKSWWKIGGFEGTLAENYYSVCFVCSLFLFFCRLAFSPSHVIIGNKHYTPWKLYIYIFIFICWSPYWCLAHTGVWMVAPTYYETLSVKPEAESIWLPLEADCLGFGYPERTTSWVPGLKTSVSRWCTFELAAFLHSQPEGGHGKSTRRPGDGLPHLTVMRDPKKWIKMVISIVVLVQLSSVGRCFFWSQFSKDWIDQPNDQQSECTYLKPAAAGVGYIVVNHTGLKGFWGSE